MKRIIIALSTFVLLAAAVMYFVHIIPETIQSAPAGKQYIVSLGDSVAAGAGLNTNDNNFDEGCDISDISSPYILGQQLHKQVLQFACSGATVDQSNNTLITQYKEAKPYIRGSDVIVYAGANDVGWLQTIISCAQKNCNNKQNNSELSDKLQILKHDLVNLLGQIQQEKPSKVIVNTYYQLAADDSTCFSKLGVMPQDVNYINQEETLLNNVIASAATETRASLVTINFSGHYLCDAQPWIQGLTDNAPFHPTAAGQKQIANQDIETLDVLPN